MSYAAERSVIDIDEFERRLRGPAPRPTADPLAELARLVTPAAAKPEALDAIFARPRPQEEPSGVAPQDDPNQFHFAGLRGAVDEQAFSANAFEGAYDRYAAPADHYAGQPDANGEWAPAADERLVNEASAPRSRRPLYAAAAVIAVGLVGVGGTFAFKGRHAGSTELVEVKAPSGPTKVQAQAVANDSASTVANSTVLDRGVAQTPVMRVIDRQEQPVDLKAAVRAPRVVSLSPAGSTQLAGPAAGESGSLFAEPRKVKTVAVRPDGTIVGGSTADAAPAPAQSQPPLPPAAPARTATPKTATPKAVARVVTTPKPPAETAEAATKPPAAKPVAAKPAHPQVAATETTASTPHTSGGGFAVQLAAPGNEAEARTIASRLGQKFSGELNGAKVTIQKAGDKSVYRVRTAGMSREAAVAACERIKASGGVCFVAKN